MNQERLEVARILRAHLSECQRRNTRYSTRAFARDLGVSQSFLSMLLNAKRSLTLRQASQIAILECLPSVVAKELLRLAREKPGRASSLAHARIQKNIRANGRSSDKTNPAQAVLLDLEHFRLISAWYHVAILDLTTTLGFNSSLESIAKRLGISLIATRDAVDRLTRLGLLKEVDGQLKKTQLKLKLPNQNPQTAIRSFHRQMIEKASIQLTQAGGIQSFLNREISGTTIATHPARLEEARIRIQRFQEELAQFLSEGPCTEVYQLNLQLFPLTVPEKNRKRKGVQ